MKEGRAPGARRRRLVMLLSGRRSFEATRLARPLRPAALARTAAPDRAAAAPRTATPRARWPGPVTRCPWCCGDCWVILRAAPGGPAAAPRLPGAFSGIWPRLLSTSGVSRRRHLERGCQRRYRSPGQPPSTTSWRAKNEYNYLITDAPYPLKTLPISTGAPAGAPPASQQTQHGSAAPDPARRRHPHLRRPRRHQVIHRQPSSGRFPSHPYIALMEGDVIPAPYLGRIRCILMMKRGAVSAADTSHIELPAGSWSRAGGSSNSCTRGSGLPHEGSPAR